VPTVRALDVFVIVAYMAALVWIGLRFSRRQNSTERYFVAKRSIPGWATGLSLLATLISSVTFIAYPGSAYADDWSNLVPGLMTNIVKADQVFPHFITTHIPAGLAGLFLAALFGAAMANRLCRELRFSESAKGRCGIDPMGLAAAYRTVAEVLLQNSGFGPWRQRPSVME
jgi:Na+/proline symporter